MIFAQVKQIDFAQAAWSILLRYNVEQSVFDRLVGWLIDEKDMETVQLDSVYSIFRNANGMMIGSISNAPIAIPDFAPMAVDSASLYTWSGKISDVAFQVWFGTKNTAVSEWLYRSDRWYINQHNLPVPNETNWFAFYDPVTKTLIGYRSIDKSEARDADSEDFTLEELVKVLGLRNRHQTQDWLGRLEETGSFITVADGGKEEKPSMSLTCVHGNKEFIELDLVGTPFYEVLCWCYTIAISKNPGEASYLVEGMEKAHLRFLRRWLELN